MWSCSFWTLPHRGLSLKDLPPRNTPDSFCRRFTRQNPSLVLRGRYFSFLHLTYHRACAIISLKYISISWVIFWCTHLESFISRPNSDTVPWPALKAASQRNTPLQNRGRNCVRCERWPEQGRPVCFAHWACVLVNVLRGSLTGIFSVARKRRKQVSTCGHKFSILENVLSTQSSLLGSAFPKPCSSFALAYSAKAACRFT